MANVVYATPLLPRTPLTLDPDDNTMDVKGGQGGRGEGEYDNLYGGQQRNTCEVMRPPSYVTVDSMNYDNSAKVKQKKRYPFVSLFL